MNGLVKIFVNNIDENEMLHVKFYQFHLYIFGKLQEFPLGNPPKEFHERQCRGLTRIQSRFLPVTNLCQ